MRGGLSDIERALVENRLRAARGEMEVKRREVAELERLLAEQQAEEGATASRRRVASKPKRPAGRVRAPSADARASVPDTTKAKVAEFLARQPGLLVRR